MTLTTTASRVNYPGADSVGPFAFPFRIFAASDLLVVKRNNSSGVETTFVYGTDYTVTGVGGSSGNVTLTTALATGETLAIRRRPAVTQPTSIRNLGTYFASTHEDEFDRLTMIDQSQQDAIDRCIKLAETLDPAAYNMTLPDPEAGKVMTGTGSGFTMSALDSSAVALPGESRTVATLSEFLANNAVYQVLDYAPPGGPINTGVNLATSAILLALAAAEAKGDGSRVQFQPGTYNFDEQIAPAKAIILEGGVAGPNNVGNHQGPTLKWVGGATATIYLSGTPCVNSRIEGISLDNEGSATIGIQIESGRVKLRHVGIVVPTVPFSLYGISVGLNGGTTPGCEFEDVTLRQAAPINLKLARIGGFLKVTGGSMMDPATGGTVSVQVGDTDPSLRADYVHFIGTTFESTTTDATNVQVLRSTQLTFFDCYFEISGASAVALDIPNTAGKAQGVFMLQCRFGAITGSPYAVRSNFASAFLDVISCNFEGTFTGIFNNQSVRQATIARNIYNGTSPVWTSSRKGVTLYGNRQTGSGAPNAAVRDDGYFVERIHTNTTAVGNVGAGEDDLMTASIEANRLYENGQVLELIAWGTTAANANNKRVRLYVGGTMVLDSGALASNNKSWVLRATVIRTGATTGAVIAEGQFNGAEIQSLYTALVVASTGWDAAQTVKVTGEATADNDVQQRAVLIKAST